MNYVKLLKKETGLENVSEIEMIGERGLAELVLRPDGVITM